MIRRFIVLVVSSFAALSCAHTPSDVATQVRTGEFSRYSGGLADSFPVGAIPDALLRDNERNRDLRLNIEYPVRPEGVRPLIVFSPAFRLTNRDYVGLSSFWASHGYVVIRASHADAGAEVDQTPTDLRNRVRDITYILDSLPRLAQQYPELEGKIDATKIAVAGHGHGTLVAMALGGAQTFPGAVRHADARVKAVVAYSPPGPGMRGLTRESWTSLAVPALFVTGTADQGLEESETPESRLEAFALAPAGDKWLVVLQGARHGTFTGRFDNILDTAARERARAPDREVDGTQIDGRGVRGREQISRSESIAFRQQDLFHLGRGLSLAFLDSYLRAETAARTALEGAGSRAGVTLERK